MRSLWGAALCSRMNWNELWGKKQSLSIQGSELHKELREEVYCISKWFVSVIQQHFVVLGATNCTSTLRYTCVSVHLPVGIQQQTIGTQRAHLWCFLAWLSINLHTHARGHILQYKPVLCHVESHVLWLFPACGRAQTLHKAAATQKNGVRMLPASIVLVSQQQPRMKETFSLKPVSEQLQISSAQCFLYLTTATSQRCNLWASHAEPKYMMRFKEDSTLQRIFPQLHSALLECSLRAWGYMLSITKHLKKPQSVCMHTATWFSSW